MSVCGNVGRILNLLGGLIMVAMKTRDQAWALVSGAPWLGGTPNSDNGNFNNLPGVNKGSGLGGDDHILGNGNTNVITGDGGSDFIRGGGGGDYLFGGEGNDILMGDKPAAIRAMTN